MKKAKGADLIDLSMEEMTVENCQRIQEIEKKLESISPKIRMLRGSGANTHASEIETFRAEHNSLKALL